MLAPRTRRATFPTVTLDSTRRAAADRARRARLVVVDDAACRRDSPRLPVLRFVIPTYVQDDPTLARVYDEKHADLLSRKLVGTPVRVLLRAERTEPPVVHGDATAVEIAAVMARLHSPLVAVVDERRLLGVVTVGRLLDRLLP